MIVGTVLFDTNVWRHLASDENAVRAKRVLRELRLQGTISPAVVDELVRTPDSETLRRLMTVACRRWWTRLPPMGSLDAEQLIEAIRRHRPGWLRGQPDVRTWSRERGAYLTNDDTSFWKLVEKKPEQYAGSLGLHREISAAQEKNTRQARKGLPPFQQTRPAEALAQTLTLSLPGTELHRRPIESWRYQAGISVMGRLDPSQAGPMFRRWVSCFVDLDRVTKIDWWRFWAEDVEPGDVSREWIRSAVFHLQATRRVGSGVAGDLGLVGHLLDVQVFATCDRPLSEILARLRPETPFPFADVVYATNLSGLLEHLHSRYERSSSSLAH